MIEKIKHLLNLDKQRVVCAGGLMGAGKSTLSREFEEVGYVIVCPDTERLLLAQEEHGQDKLEGELIQYLQSYSEQAWKNSHNKVIDALKEGKSVFFDATLSTPKARRQIQGWLDQAKIKIKITMVYLDVPLEVAIERNEKRGYTQTGFKNGEPIFGRYVPEHVIELKNRTQVLPMIDEGFEEVVIVSQELKRLPSYGQISESIFDDLIQDPRKTILDLKNNQALDGIFPYLDACWGISQDNIHHNRTLEEHMITAAEIVVDKFSAILNKDELRLIVVSTLNHDIGKKDTKQFFGTITEDYEGMKENEKVIISKKLPVGAIVRKKPHFGFYETIVPYNVIDFDPNAHFYEHERVGAVQMRRNILELGWDEYFANDVYALILHHMLLPYQMTSNKAMSKFMRTVGFDSNGRSRAKQLLYIRYGDKMSGNTDPNFEEIHHQMMEQLEELQQKGRKH